jgi:flagellin
VIEHGGINTSASTAGIYDLNATNENVALSAATATFISATNPIRDLGQDVEAIVNAIRATSKGKVLRVNTDYLDLSIGLSDSGAQTRATFDAFVVTGGGAKFNLGPDVNISNQVSVGIGNVAVRHLGAQTVGFLDDLGSGESFNVVNGNLEEAQKVVDAAISQVSTLRGRLGAFQKNVVGATIRSLNVALENTSAAESAIRDTDFASETASLTRSQILVNAATNVLSIANSQPQNVLQLLG